MRALVIAATALLALGCVPDVDDDESRLGAVPRVLAVRAEPAEAEPGDSVRYVALYADERGAIDEAPVDFAYCIARKPLAELGPVARACIAESGDALAPIGVGVDVTGTIPMDACRLFGPEAPLAMPGEPPGRPVDPDATGGYSQPLRVLAPDGDQRISVAAQRVSCGLAGATPEQSAEWRARYLPNVSPEIATLELEREDGSRVTLEQDVALTVRGGERLTLHAAWPSCPEDTEASCTGAERFLYFDPATRELVVRREAIRVAWYASAGELAEERTGVAPDELENASTNELVAPPEGTVVGVVVLRDDRGAASWRTFTLAANP